MEKLANLGAARDKLKVFRNGVDLERFQALPRDLARQRIGIADKPGAHLILSVGNLIELKGHHLAIEALQKLPEETRLAIIGKGSERPRLAALAHQLGVADRVHFAGVIQPDELKWWYSAADTLVLCSSREGWPNVILEAMACGTPVIATNVGGVREMLPKEAGILLKGRSSEEVASALRHLFTTTSDRKHIRHHAESFSWDETSRAQLQLFSRISHA